MSVQNRSGCQVFRERRSKPGSYHGQHLHRPATKPKRHLVNFRCILPKEHQRACARMRTLIFVSRSSLDGAVQRVPPSSLLVDQVWGSGMLKETNREAIGAHGSLPNYGNVDKHKRTWCIHAPGALGILMTRY